MDCSNCGKFGHGAQECKLRKVGPVCIRCQKYGHTTGQCSRRSSQQGRRNVKFMGLQGEVNASSLVGEEWQAVIHAVLKRPHVRFEKTVSESTRIASVTD